MDFILAPDHKPIAHKKNRKNLNTISNMISYNHKLYLKHHISFLKAEKQKSIPVTSSIDPGGWSSCELLACIGLELDQSDLSNPLP